MHADLSYTHSSGKNESKADVIKSVTTGPATVEAITFTANTVRVSYEPNAYPRNSEHVIDTSIRNMDYYPVLWGTRYAHLYMVDYYWNGRSWVLMHNFEVDRWQISTLWSGACWYHTSYTSGYANSGDWFYYQLVIDGSDSNGGNNSTSTGWIVQPNWIY